MVNKLSMTGGRERSDIGKVYDEVGVVRQRKEAIPSVEKVLNDGGRLGVQDEVESEKASYGNELMSECLTREEVLQTLGSLKKKSAPGSDGLTAEMVCCNVLVDVWYSLFNWCWRYRRVPSEWRKSVIIPVPKRKRQGVCKVDDFRGISLTSIAYKAMCSIVHRRLVHMVEEKQLVDPFF